MGYHFLHRCHHRLTASRFKNEITTQLESTSNVSPGFSKKRKISQVATGVTECDERRVATTMSASANPIGQRAKQKQTDREFFADILGSAATKRDAKAYIDRLKSATKAKPSPSQHDKTISKVNLGNLFGGVRALETSPVFSQHALKEQGFEEQEVQHVALVKLSDTHEVPSQMLQGIAQTLSQLSRLSMAPCVVLDIEDPTRFPAQQTLASESERLATMLDVCNDSGARVLENVFAILQDGTVTVNFPKLLRAPLKRRQIPVVLPVAYSEVDQVRKPISADKALLAIVRDFDGYIGDSHKQHNDVITPETGPDEEISLDRIILVDKTGGIPGKTAADGKHVFINLQQEFRPLHKESEENQSKILPKHMSNLTLLRDALDLLPSYASGLITTPVEAANLPEVVEPQSSPGVGTRRQKNTLIHNLLTDKPTYSSSLPKARLARSSHRISQFPVATFVKRGMPLRIIPDPLAQPWTAEASRIRVTDPSIDLKRLVHLIDDSFNRSLDIEKYLERVNDTMAGVIIAGDYEGGAILTWEIPPDAPPDDLSRQVPYLDKFAVLKRSQGAGGVADIVFNAMVRTCFPRGVCWRSRKDNPVNKWYFERSSGTWKIPDTNWTMFWTTPGISQHDRLFGDYEGVCRGVQPTWADSKKVVD